MSCKGEEEDVVRSFDGITSLPEEKGEAAVPLHLTQMSDGAPSTASGDPATGSGKDYVSSFTTYLLGDETHPGAEESQHRRDRSSRCSSHDGEVATTHSWDIPPRRHLEVFEGSLPTETTPTNQEIQAASEAGVLNAQDRPSTLPSRSEGQEKSEEKLSESSQFLADAPEPSPTAAVISSIKQKDVAEPTTTEGVHQWEPEGTSWIGGDQQQGVLEEVADTEQHQHGEAERPEGKQPEEQGQGEEIAEEREEEQVGTVWYDGFQQIAPDLTLFMGEEHRGLEGVARVVGFQLSGLEEEEVKMVEGQQLEAARPQEDEAEMEEDQLEETNMVAAKEGMPQTMPGRAETEGDQEEMLGGEEDEVGRSHLWEPKEEVEGTRETEGGQEKELGGTLWYGGIQEGVSGWAQFLERQQRGLEKTIKKAEVEQEQKEEPEAEGQEGEIWTMGFRHRGLEKEEEKVKMVNGQQLEVEQEQEEEPEVEEILQEEPDIAVEEEIQQAVPGMAETEGQEEEQLGEEKGAGRRHQWEPKETAVALKEQDGEPKRIAENRDGQQGELAGVEETEGTQQREVEEPVGNEAAEQQVELTGEEWLEESDQEGESERLAEASGLIDTEVLEAAGVQPKQTEEMDSSWQQEPMVCSASIAGTFPVEVTPLDTSHQKERVLLRRKSSIRRAPSMKRQPVETQPEISVAEEVPAQPQTPRRKNPRHSGFGPMHPNMMAELQMRLRKPQ